MNVAHVLIQNVLNKSIWWWNGFHTKIWLMTRSSKYVLYVPWVVNWTIVKIKKKKCWLLILQWIYDHHASEKLNSPIQLAWPFPILQNDYITISWDFFQADSTKVSWHDCWCCQPEKTSWYRDIIILYYMQWSPAILRSNDIIRS